MELVYRCMCALKGLLPNFLVSIERYVDRYKIGIHVIHMTKFFLWLVHPCWMDEIPSPNELYLSCIERFRV
jgi:hypothetical protein